MSSGECLTNASCGEAALGLPSIRMEVVPRLTMWGKTAWFSRWEDGESTVKVWAQPAIGSEPVTFAGRYKVESVTNVLIPDVVVAVAKRDAAGLRVYDSKFTTKDPIAPGTVPDTGSKYMWGFVRAAPSMHPR